MITAVCIGVVTGIASMLLGLLLRYVQHLGYGYCRDCLEGSPLFLREVSAAVPTRRVMALIVGGLIAGLGWTALSRWGSSLVSVEQVIKGKDRRLPLLPTIIHALLQIITVALGSPLGRESAPREIAALFSSRITERLGLSKDLQRTLTACAAGAGLAAIYNVPFGGILFTLEALLGTFAATAVLPATIVSVTATLVARIGLGDEVLYLVPHFPVTPSLIVWALLCGPAFGLAAYAFTRATQWARRSAPDGWQRVLWCFLFFSVMGILSIKFPEIPGNGRGIGVLSFQGHMAITLAAALLLLRSLVIVGSLRAGAAGGLLTPGMTLGCLMALLLGQAWTLIWPGTPLGGFALVGAAAFLASSMKMPVTAIVLTMEFTRSDYSFLVPICIAVAGSVFVSQFCLNSTNRTLPTGESVIGGMNH